MGIILTFYHFILIQGERNLIRWIFKYFWLFQVLQLVVVLLLDLLQSKIVHILLLFCHNSEWLVINILDPESVHTVLLFVVYSVALWSCVVSVSVSQVTVNFVKWYENKFYTESASIKYFVASHIHCCWGSEKPG